MFMVERHLCTQEKLKKKLDWSQQHYITLLRTVQKVSWGRLAWPLYQYRTPIDYTPIDSGVIANSAARLLGDVPDNTTRAAHPSFTNLIPKPSRPASVGPSAHNAVWAGLWVTRGMRNQLRSKHWMPDDMQASYSAHVSYLIPRNLVSPKYQHYTIYNPLSDRWVNKAPGLQAASGFMCASAVVNKISFFFFLMGSLTESWKVFKVK